MNRKRILGILLCLTLSAGLLAGCGSQPDTSENAQTGKITPAGGNPQAEDSSQTAEPLPTATPEPVVIPLSDPIDTALWQKENTSDLMDFACYLPASLELHTMSSSADTVAKKFSWGEDDYSILEDYIKLLCTEYDFEQSGETYYEYIWDTTFFDMVLRYTGDKTIPYDDLKGVHSDNFGNLVIYGKLDKYGRMEGVIDYHSALTADDDGYRHGQKELANLLPGASAGAGLEYYDGTYRTTDGRLTTTLDHAAFLTDGKTTDYAASYEINTSDGRLTVTVEDKYKNIMERFYIRSLVDWHDGLYPASDFAIDASYASLSGGVNDSCPTMTWSTMFATVHNSQYVYPIWGLRGEMTGLTFRVMYMDEKVIVFYTCATFRSEPTMTEALIAVNIDVEPVSEEKQQSSSGSSGSSRCFACSGSGNCSSCSGRGRVNEWTGAEYMYLPCTRCGQSGKCWSCNGSGKK